MTIKHLYFLSLVTLPFFFSCVDTRKSTYFNGISDEEIQYKAQSIEPVIQKNDLLSISVSSMNPEATQPFNLYTITAAQGNTTTGTISQVSGFLVDQDGNIQFPMLGTIRAAGLNKKQLKDVIAKGLAQKNLLYDPVVNIRYLNYKITVLGEVAHPSVLNVPNEKISLLEAIGLAGDLTPYAQRDNVLIIHEGEEGKRFTKRINLNDTVLLSSPYYYLQSNDIVYVAPNKSKVASTGSAKQWLPAVLSGLSFVSIIVYHLTK